MEPEGWRRDRPDPRVASSAGRSWGIPISVQDFFSSHCFVTYLRLFSNHLMLTLPPRFVCLGAPLATLARCALPNKAFVT